MKLRTFVIVMSSVFVLLMGGCGAMGMSLSQGQAAGDIAGGADARAPGDPGADIAPVTTRCAADIRRQGLPSNLAPEGQSSKTHLTTRMQNVKSQVEEKFDGSFLTIGGWRPTDSISLDHPCGRAIDIMVSRLGHPANRQQIANGFAIATWAEQNAKVLGVHYIMFQQCIWNVQRATESGCRNIPAGVDGKGWRPFADRGSVTQNHDDHVHISVW